MTFSNRELTMGKDKEYDARMQGMWLAYKTLEEKGKDALKDEIVKRGYYGIDPRMKISEMDKMLLSVCTTIYNNVLTCSAYALNQQFGFDKEQLHQYKYAFEKVTDDSYDWNYLSHQFVTMTDYAVYLNKTYELGINVDRVSANEDSFQETREKREAYKREFTKGIINTLKLNGYHDASMFLESKFE